jgi:hypothetical protein
MGWEADRTLPLLEWVGIQPPISVETFTRDLAFGQYRCGAIETSFITVEF